MKIPISKTILNENEISSVLEPLRSGWLVQGPKVKQFEEKWCEFTKAKHSIAVTSCTTAMTLSLIALGLKEGDEAIVPAFTWISTANVVEQLGGKVVFCDINLDSFNLDISQIEDKITTKTKVILPVHLFGLPVEMDPIIELSKKYNLKIYQQTNLINFEDLEKFYKENNIDFELFHFNKDISNFMSRSNICLTRAGASTLAELVFLNLPSVAIPLPTSKDNHQFENAFFYNKLGCNWILNQNEINNEIITNKLMNIIDNKEEYFVKKKNMKNFSYQNTWNNINQKIISVINENRISKN